MDSPKPAEPSGAEVLRRVGPALVSVHCGSWWGTGFVFGSRRTIVTSLSLVDDASAVEVLIADGTTHTARVSAWSKGDNLALLELDVDAAHEPLSASSTAPVVGMDAMFLYQARGPRENVEGWVAPLPRFTRVTRSTRHEIGLDMSPWGMTGDDGAVVLSPDGQVLGVRSERSAELSRLVVTGVERVQHLLRQRSQQGEFTPSGHGRWFASVFLTPIYSTYFQSSRERSTLVGFGTEFGYRYKLAFASLGLNLLESNSRHLDTTTLESFTRWEIPLYTGLDWQLSRTLDVFAAPGVALRIDDLQTTTIATDGRLTTKETGRAQVRPLFTLGASAGYFYVRDVFTLGSPPEVRIDFGFSSRSQRDR